MGKQEQSCRAAAAQQQLTVTGVAIYGRCSSQHGMPVAEQLRECRAAATGLGLVVREENTFSEN